jgi:hypothetical protein
MALATNAAVLYQNRSDSGTIVAGAAVATTPVTLLQNKHVGRKTRTLATSENYVIDLGAAYSIDTVFMAGLNLTAAGTSRVRASLVDATATGTLLYDSTVLTGLVDPNYKTLVNLQAAPVTVRYLRIDLVDATLAYIEAGRLAIGLRTQFTYNYATGQSSGRVDPAIKVKSRGGQTHVITEGGIPRVWEFSFGTLTETERNGLIESIQIACGARTDILFIKKPTSSNLGRDSIWGLVTEISPIVSPGGFIGGAPVYSTAYKIEERL